MMEDLFTIHYLALAFAAVLALLWIVFESSRKPPLKPREKARIFACGMEASPGELNVPQEGYYGYMKRFFRTERLSEAHSGRLSSYIAWIIIGLAIILSVMVIMW
jgi:hypothetical protein